MTDKKPINLHEARNSYTGKSLTNSQFTESWALTGVIAREIRKSGSFREKLTDYAHAFARSQKFDAMKGEAILRDIYKSRYGETMNQTREGFLERENTLREVGTEQALHHARSVMDKITSGETMPFYQAYDQAAVGMAKKHNITERGAKEMMKTSYRDAEGKELFDSGKSLEKSHHGKTKETVKEAATNQRSANSSQAQSDTLVRKRG